MYVFKVFEQSPQTRKAIKKCMYLKSLNKVLKYLNSVRKPVNVA